MNIPSWLSDGLCRIATGSGFATRELYSDGDETIFNVQRPILLNGIEELATRSDLIDRSIFLSLPRITEKSRITEAQFWSEFDEVKGKILGWLLDKISTAIGQLPTTELDTLPRMADFAKWVSAAETSINWPGPDLRFLDAYGGNRQDSNEAAIEASIIGKPVLEYLSTHGEFEGNSSDLLEALDAHADESTRQQRKKANSGWPKGARAISGKLRRIAPNLRNAGVIVELGLRNRHLRMSMEPTVPTVPRDDVSGVKMLANAKVSDETSFKEPPEQIGDGRYGRDDLEHCHTTSQVCDCGAMMLPSQPINGWQNWDCSSCDSVVPVKLEQS